MRLNGTGFYRIPAFDAGDLEADPKILHDVYDFDRRPVFWFSGFALGRVHLRHDDLSQFQIEGSCGGLVTLEEKIMIGKIFDDTQYPFIWRR